MSEPSLERRLGPFDAAAIILSNVIGGGIFFVPILVAGLVPNGPGARSGIREGDVILSLDARQVPTRKDLYLSLWRRGPGERIALEVMRDNELTRLDVTGGDRADFYKQIS